MQSNIEGEGWRPKLRHPFVSIFGGCTAVCVHCTAAQSGSAGIFDFNLQQYHTCFSGPPFHGQYCGQNLVVAFECVWGGFLLESIFNTW